ncbi:MAG: FixH family protein [Chloroflexota bacterium]
MLRKLILLPSLFVLLTACGGRNSNQANNSNLDIAVDVESMMVGATDLMVTILDENGSPVNDATVSIKGDMSHAGMQPVLGESSSGSAGVYTIPYEWTMAGDWFITVDVSRPDGETASARFDFSGIGGDMEGEMDHGDMDHGEIEMEMDGEEMESGSE